VLHEQRIIDYDGTFAEWETVSAERAHAAAVAAAEEEAVRRARERKQVRRPPSPSREDRAAKRTAQRDLERAEAEVGRLEARVAEVTRVLEDPQLYTTSEGVARATALGVELDAARRALDEAIARWERAVQVVEAAGSSS
jgi:hypothetical protein